MEIAFPGAVSDRSTYILGIRPSNIEDMASTPLHFNSISSPPAFSYEALRAENASLKSRVVELEAEVQSLHKSSVPFATIEKQADRLLNHSSIAYGPDTLEHLQSFSISSILCNVKREAPDLFHLFQQVGNTRRNAQGENIAVEEIKGWFLCVHFSTQDRRE